MTSATSCGDLGLKTRRKYKLGFGFSHITVGKVKRISAAHGQRNGALENYIAN